MYHNATRAGPWPHVTRGYNRSIVLHQTFCEVWTRLDPEICEKTSRETHSSQYSTPLTAVEWRCYNIISNPNKKLSYRQWTGWRAMSVKNVLNVTQMFVKLHLLSPSLGEWTSRSSKVIGNGTNTPDSTVKIHQIQFRLGLCPDPVVNHVHFLFSCLSSPPFLLDFPCHFLFSQVTFSHSRISN